MKMIMKKINKKIIKNILNKFPNSDIHDLIIISPNDFLIPDFDDLVKINYKNFKSYLLFNQLNSNLPQKIKSSQLKI